MSKLQMFLNDCDRIADWQMHADQFKKFLIKCTATTDNVRGCFIGVYSPIPRKVGSVVNYYGENWTVESCEEL